MSLLEIRDLRYTYPDGTNALDGATLTVARGEKVALVGANGSGKSTLLLHITGCLVPSEGEVFVDGQDVPGNLKAVRTKVGMVFQDPDDQLFLPTVLEDVAFTLCARGVESSEAKKKALSVLESLGMAHLESRAPHRLSGGEKKLVALAGILVPEPELLVFDEPSSGLDPRSRKRIIHVLSRLEQGMIVATHDLDLALDLCSSAVVLCKGRTVEQGGLPDLFYREGLLERYGLELPLGLHPRKL